MIVLEAGALRCDIDPATGGAIAAFRSGEQDLLRPVVDPKLHAQHGRAVAAYPLLPFVNRLAWGRFTWREKTYEVERNFGDHPHPIHGNAWMHPWAVVSHTAREVLLAFAHAALGEGAREWPFPYRAEQHFALTETGLAVSVSLTNSGAEPFPAALGLHPYGARDADTRLRFRARTMWPTGADSLPDPATPVPPWADFSTLRPLEDAAIDNAFAGWNGEAEIVWRHGRMTIAAGPPLDHVQLYTPPGRDYFGCEPVSAMPDALNRPLWPDCGFRVLAPGETLAGTIRFGVFLP